MIGQCLGRERDTRRLKKRILVYIFKTLDLIIVFISVFLIFLGVSVLMLFPFKPLIG